MWLGTEPRRVDGGRKTCAFRKIEALFGWWGEWVKVRAGWISSRAAGAWVGSVPWEKKRPFFGVGKRVGNVGGDLDVMLLSFLFGLLCSPGRFSFLLAEGFPPPRGDYRKRCPFSGKSLLQWTTAVRTAKYTRLRRQWSSRHYCTSFERALSIHIGCPGAPSFMHAVDGWWHMFKFSPSPSPPPPPPPPPPPRKGMRGQAVSSG